MFRTEIPSEKPRFNIDMDTNILSMGSCFAKDIGKRLEDHKLGVDTNPGGILFNPLSIFELMELAHKQHVPAENTFLTHEGIFLNHKFHSEVNGTTESDLRNQIEAVKKALRGSLKKANLIILTFGTAWVYKSKADGALVANCHKAPQTHFTKELLTVDEIVIQFGLLKKMIQELNPEVRFLLTVSPVRHIKDTIPLNSVSKSVLRLACHQIREQHTEADYFPSYELMMDDLRDYRFYKKDMIHPNEQAVDYIWQKFIATFFSKSAQSFIHEWAKLKNTMQHKPFHPVSPAHQQFLKDLILKVQNLSEQVDVSKELTALKSQLI
ncbi:MAG: GSCFA domain-containing protein [Roseivirga sp.]